VFAQFAKRRSNVDLTQDGVSSQFTLQLYVTSEPKARLRTEKARMIITKMVDENGKSLYPSEEPVMLTRPAGGRLYATFQLPDSTGRKIARIEGQVLGDMATRIDEYRVDDLSSLPKSLKVGEIEITVDSLKQTDGQNWQLTLTGPLMRGRIGNLLNDFGMSGGYGSEGFRVVDQNGRSMNTALTGQRQSNDGSTSTITMNLTSEPGAKPTKLLWQVIGQTREVKIPFEISDLPLP
jgi:hypothetical protein